jgi:heat shock protein HslJ
MRSRPLLLLAAVLAVLVAACSAGTGTPEPTVGGGPPAAGDTGGLEGRAFLATDAIGRALVPGSLVRISFADGQVGASGGCNSMGGPYAIDGDHLVVRQLAMTEMACEPRLMGQDAWLASLLDGATIRLDGDTLTLSNDGAALTLVDREVADPDRPLVDTRWIVDGLVTGDAVSSVPVGVVAALTFSDGRVEVEAGCNRGGGAVAATDVTLTFGPIALTKMACEGGAMEVERLVSEVLSGRVQYTIEAGTLTLDAGAAGLTLRGAQ